MDAMIVITFFLFHGLSGGDSYAEVLKRCAGVSAIVKETLIGSE